MIVYFSEHRLLYGSDPFHRRKDSSYFSPQTVHGIDRRRFDDNLIGEGAGGGTGLLPRNRRAGAGSHAG